MQDSVKQDRERYIGGSDIPIIMELSPFKSRFDLLLEKAGYKIDDFTGNEYTKYGQDMEPIIRDYINSHSKDLFIPFNADFTEGKHVREADDGEIIGVRIHTDGESDNAILEIKTTSEISPRVEDYKIYLSQLLFYMVNTGKEFGLLAVYERPEDLSLEFDVNRLHLYPIRLSDFQDFIEEISDNLERFIDDLYKVKANPFITELELLPSDINKITRRILSLEDQKKTLDNMIEQEKSRLIKAMDNIGKKSIKTGDGYTLTRIAETQDKIVENEELDLDSLKRDLPDLFKPFGAGGYLVTTTTTKKGSKGYLKITAPKKSKKED